MLIDDLRAFARVSQSSYAACEAMDKAATQLEAMQAEIERLESALRVRMWNELREQGVDQERAIRKINADIEAIKTVARASLDNSKEGEK